MIEAERWYDDSTDRKNHRGPGETYNEKFSDIYKRWQKEIDDDILGKMQDALRQDPPPGPSSGWFPQ